MAAVEKSAAEIFNDLPDEVKTSLKDMADRLGVDVEQIVKGMGSAPTAAPAAAPAQPAVQPAEVETTQQRLERELAVSQQETQQARALAQAATSSQVVGGSGVGPTAEPQTPSLAQIEPGIRFAFRNGLISEADVKEKLGPILTELLLQDTGGTH